MRRKIFSVMFILQLSVAVVAKPPRVNREAIRYTVRLPAVDKVELEKFKTSEMWIEGIEATKVLEGREAQSIAALWRRQDYRLGSAECHYPAFGIKFYSGGKLIAHASLCWMCDNVAFLTPGLRSKQGFAGKSRRGKELLDLFARAFPR
jgi:hypothetical protein